MLEHTIQYNDGIWGLRRHISDTLSDCTEQYCRLKQSSWYQDEHKSVLLFMCHFHFCYETASVFLKPVQSVLFAVAISTILPAGGELCLWEGRCRCPETARAEEYRAAIIHGEKNLASSV
jgi:hypothetical protein